MKLFWLSVLAACGTGALEFEAFGEYEGVVTLTIDGSDTVLPGTARVDSLGGLTTLELYPGCVWELEETSRDDLAGTASYVLPRPVTCSLEGVELRFVSGTAVFDMTGVTLVLNGSSCATPCEDASLEIPVRLAFEGVYARMPS